MVSTTGQGEQATNAKRFWKKLLRKKLGPNSLQALRFAIFGLGDSSYPHYNFAALKLRKRIIQLGAVEIVDPGRGDEQHPEGHDGTFMTWTQALRAMLVDLFPLEADLEPVPEHVLLEPQWLLSTLDEQDVDVTPYSPPDLAFAQPERVEDFDVVLKENLRLTPLDHWQDVRHMSFTSPKTVHYSPGDVLVVYPENHPNDVDKMIDLMGWHTVVDQPIMFRPNPLHTSSAFSLPMPSSYGRKTPTITLRSLLTKDLDFNAVPRRSFFSLLVHFTSDEFQKERLLEFTRPEYLDELYDYTTRPRRSILEVLEEFDTAKIPYSWAAATLPVLRGRQFSIASGGELRQGPEGSTVFELLIAIVEYQTVIRKVRRGVCTQYLAGLAVGTKLSVSLERRAMAFRNSRTEMPPLIMIGPGTGVAPLRSLIWERRCRRARAVSNEAREAEILFFGGRNAKADYFFRHEWAAHVEESNLEVFSAFSRDQAQKIYVQDLLRLHAARVWSLLEDEAIVYVCGSSGKMPQAVREALIQVVEKEGALSRMHAEQRIQHLERCNLYKQVLVLSAFTSLVADLDRKHGEMGLWAQNIKICTQCVGSICNKWLERRRLLSN